MEAKLWFHLTTTQVKVIMDSVKNSDGAKTNMVFHGNLILKNNFFSRQAALPGEINEAENRKTTATNKVNEIITPNWLLRFKY